jgi:hypothetical protein
MRKTYHFCLASHDEVLHRSEEDYIYDVNCFAAAVVRTESRALADAVMSSHDHFCAQTDNVSELAFLRRNAYTRYFNTKYERKGRLGEKYHFVSELRGIRHITAAVSYVNRNPLHHGISPTPFSYKYCSSNSVFQTELGKGYHSPLLPAGKKYLYLPSNVVLPESFRMDASGMVLQEDLIDVRYVEELYVTPRSFLYMMNRYSDEKWIAEQKEEDPSVQAVTLENIEQALMGENTERMKMNEKGRTNMSAMTDIELCSIIDTQYVPGYGQVSVYGLSDVQKQKIGNELWRKHQRRTTENQIRRCLAM